MFVNIELIGLLVIFAVIVVIVIKAK